MSVIRIRKSRQKPYVILDTTALNDDRLSFRAKGIHTYLMAKPDDWHVHIEQLEKQSPKEGRDAIRGALQELEACGYIRRQRLRGEKGRMAGWDTTVYETPLLAELDAEDERLAGNAIGIETDEPPITDYPTSVQPTSVQPSSANPQLVFNDFTQYGVVPSIDSTYPPDNANALSSPVDEVVNRSHRKKPQKRDTIPEWSDDLPWPDPYSLVALYHAKKPESWSSLEIISKARLAKLTEYLKQFPSREFWERVFRELNACQWLKTEMYASNRTLDWLLQKGKHDTIENCIKVAEGQYNRNDARSPPKSPTDLEARKKRLMGMAGLSEEELQNWQG